MTQTADRLAPYDRYVAHVQAACRTDPGKRAALRSGLGRRPEQAYRMHAVVARWLDAGAGPAKERAFYTVASLIAAQPPSARSEPDEQQGDVGKRTSLGAALGLVAKTLPGDRRRIAEGSAERRLHLLVRQGVDGIHRQLPVTVRLVRAAGIPVDWVRLIDELSRWPTDHDRIAKRWLQDFYRTVQPSLGDDNEQE